MGTSFHPGLPIPYWCRTSMRRGARFSTGQGVNITFLMITAVFCFFPAALGSDSPAELPVFPVGQQIPQLSPEGFLPHQGIWLFLLMSLVTEIYPFLYWMMADVFHTLKNKHKTSLLLIIQFSRSIHWLLNKVVRGELATHLHCCKLTNKVERDLNFEYCSSINFESSNSTLSALSYPAISAQFLFCLDHI